jgi:hypothetical protein
MVLLLLLSSSHTFARVGEGMRARRMHTFTLANDRLSISLSVIHEAKGSLSCDYYMHHVSAYYPTVYKRRGVKGFLNNNVATAS